MCADHTFDEFYRGSKSELIHGVGFVHFNPLRRNFEQDRNIRHRSSLSHVGLPRPHHPDGLLQLVHGRPFQQIARRTRLKGGSNILDIGMNGHKNHLDRRLHLSVLQRGIDAVQ